MKGWMSQIVIGIIVTVVAHGHRQCRRQEHGWQGLLRRRPLRGPVQGWAVGHFT